MTTYKELLAQREALDKTIEEARKQEIAGAVSQVKALISDFGLTEDDVFGAGSGSKKSGKATSKVAAKYRDPVTGSTWTGRGKAPRWLDGKDKAQYLIA